MKASRNSAFYWNTGEPSIFATDRSFTAQGESGTSLQEKATARFSKKVAGLQDPVAMQRKGGITIAPRDIDSTAKADRLRKAGI